MIKIDNLQDAINDITDTTQKELCQKELNRLIETISKTQMALASTNPIQAEFTEGKGNKFTCIHCGSIITGRYKDHKREHFPDCIWKVALLAIGDYPEKEKDG